MTFSLKIGDNLLIIAKEDHRNDCAFGAEQVGGNLRRIASQDRVSIDFVESISNLDYP
jgi:hypothetical protein